MKKIALITGTTAGIGEATATLFAQNGYDLILNGRREDRLLEQANELEGKFGIRTKILPVDVRDYDAVSIALNGLPDDWKKVNILVNNAGLAAGLGTLESGLVDDWNRMIDTNIKGLLHVTKTMIPLLKDNGGGHIVNISSIAGKEVYPGGNVYCGTKHMVDALNKAMRRELVEAGIKVTSINPGAVETEFSIVRLHGDEEKAKKVYLGYENLVAMDVAEAIWFAVSRPKHVNINELIIMPTAQPAAGLIHRDAGI